MHTHIHTASQFQETRCVLVLKIHNYAIIIYYWQLCNGYISYIPKDSKYKEANTWTMAKLFFHLWVLNLLCPHNTFTQVAWWLMSSYQIATSTWKHWTINFSKIKPNANPCTGYNMMIKPVPLWKNCIITKLSKLKFFIYSPMLHQDSPWYRITQRFAFFGTFL